MLPSASAQATACILRCQHSHSCSLHTHSQLHTAPCTASALAVVQRNCCCRVDAHAPSAARPEAHKRGRPLAVSNDWWGHGSRSCVCGTNSKRVRAGQVWVFRAVWRTHVPGGWCARSHLAQQRAGAAAPQRRRRSARPGQLLLRCLRSSLVRRLAAHAAAMLLRRRLPLLKTNPLVTDACCRCRVGCSAQHDFAKQCRWRLCCSSCQAPVHRLLHLLLPSWPGAQPRLRSAASWACAGRPLRPRLPACCAACCCCLACRWCAGGTGLRRLRRCRPTARRRGGAQTAALTETR